LSDARRDVLDGREVLHVVDVPVIGQLVDANTFPVTDCSSRPLTSATIIDPVTECGHDQRVLPDSTEVIDRRRWQVGFHFLHHVRNGCLRSFQQIPSWRKPEGSNPATPDGPRAAFNLDNFWDGRLLLSTGSVLTLRSALTSSRQ
jgi:hypothetical protein